MSPGSIERRLARAEKEIASAPSYEYIVENADLDEAVSQIKAIVVASRSHRNMRLLGKAYPKVVEHLQAQIAELDRYNRV